MINKRTIIITVSIAAVVIIAIILCVCLVPPALEKAEKEKIIKADLANVEPSIFAIAEDYGIDDLVFKRRGSYNVIQYTSEKFKALSQEQCLYLLEDTIKDSYLESYRLDGAAIDGVVVEINGYYYGHSKGYGELRYYSKCVLEIKTDYAQAKYQEYLDEKENSSNNGSICGICNGTGSVKYFYGDTPFYDFGPCTSCDGTGRK